MMHDANYPWCLLIPEVNTIEYTDLTSKQYQQLMQDSLQLQQAMQTLFKPHKLNVAMLGNVISQLHIHHIARFNTDAAWPDPVWNTVPAKPYSASDLRKIIDQLIAVL